MVVRLLLGLILAVGLYALVRIMAPGRTLLAGAALGAGAVALVALNPGALQSAEFWAGIVGFAAILSALMIVIHPNPMVSVLFLIVNLFCVALFYLFLNAQFLSALQVIIYAGAIMVLFLFVVMLLNLKAEEGLTARGGPQRYVAVILGGLFAGMMFDAILHRGPQPYFEPGSFDSGFGTARELGGLLFTRYLFAFEAASLLLIAAMIGAVILAKRRLR